MTPDKARDLLDGTTPGPWHLSPYRSVVGIKIVMYDGTVMERQNVALADAAPDMAAMIAGMREEWGVEERHEYTGEWHWHSTYPDRESALSRANGMGHFRAARRYVTEPEEA